MKAPHTKGPHWRSGEVIAYDKVVFGRSKVVIPMVVVDDRPGLLMLHRPSGTVVARLSADDRPDEPVIWTPGARPDGPAYVTETWDAPHAELVLIRHGEAHGIHMAWSLPDWTLIEWYVNLQRPIERFAGGIRVHDQVLDLVVLPDLSWRWEDEADVAQAVEQGRISQREAEGARREGERVLRDARARRWPFDGSLEAWRPDPAWRMPHLPDVTRG